MLDALLNASPSAGAWRHDPMTVSDIDNHPDCDRIWATLRALRDEADAAYQRGFEEGSSDVDDAVKEEFDRCVEEFERWSERFIDAHEASSGEDIRDALLAVDCEGILR